MTDTDHGRKRRHVSRWVISLAAMVAVGGLAATIGVTSAGYTDDASARIEVAGFYDIALKGTNLSGAVEENQGSPSDFSIKLTEGAKFNRTEAIYWDIAVISKGAGGAVSLEIADTNDAPFTIGSTTFPDLFGTLLFHVEDRDTNTVLHDWAKAEDPVAVGLIAPGSTRNLRVSAVVAPDTLYVYHNRTTGVRLIFQGTT